MPRPDLERSVSRGIFVASSTLALVAIASTFVVRERAVGMVALRNTPVMMKVPAGISCPRAPR